MEFEPQTQPFPSPSSAWHGEISTLGGDGQDGAPSSLSSPSMDTEKAAEAKSLGTITEFVGHFPSTSTHRAEILLSAHGAFSRINHVLGHKISLYRFKRIWNHAMFSDHNEGNV